MIAIVRYLCKVYNFYKLEDFRKIGDASVSFALSRTILSLAGLPPLVGFIPKLIVILAASEYPIILAFLLLGSVIALGYYVNVVFFVLLSLGERYSPPFLKIRYFIRCVNLLGSIVFLVVFAKVG